MCSIERCHAKDIDHVKGVDDEYLAGTEKQYFCDTLEPTWRDYANGAYKVKGRSAIPEGCYAVVISYSPKMQQWLPILLGVPKFEGIRIHAGNCSEDTESCILVGKNREVSKVLDCMCDFQHKWWDYILTFQIIVVPLQSQTSRSNTDMRKRLMWMWASILICGTITTLTSCHDIIDNPVSAETTEQQEQVVMTDEEILGMVDRVTIIKDTIDYDQSRVVYFYFKQPIDHNNPEAGTFQQYCVLHYEHPDSITVLHTQGYSTAERKYLSQSDLSKIFNGNYLEVEHRYYKRSRIGNPEKEYLHGQYWQYNTAAQSTADLHDIVKALKATKAFNGKWISTGVSKNGMLTALYAYYYPNDIDVYVPFCAPFCVELESSSVGRYLREQCGKGTTAQQKCWDMLDIYLVNPELQEEVAELYKADYPLSYKVRHYSLLDIKRVMIYKFMTCMFQKLAYHPISEWEDVIPEPMSSAKLYYLFMSLGRDNFNKKLRELRKLYELEMEEDYYEYDLDTYDEYEDFEDYDDEDDLWDENNPEELQENKVVPGRVLQDIASVHAATELGYFLHDWGYLRNQGLIDDSDIQVFYDWQTVTKFNKIYEVTYDGGALMNNFLDFVHNNRNDKKCRMLFVYGANDPWTGAAIPDPAADDPYVKKYVVPNGVHSGHLNKPEHYSQKDKDYIISTIRGMMARPN